ncbi:MULTISPECIES: hypothetical protein [unclassified Synechococcus]|uniref:hypothetical protein n=1 Tax=Synechococcales TaxID=1890424 RepID=UPI0021053B27|nr:MULTISPECIES: hypothetical protein [unclassified Synechococcus]
MGESPRETLLNFYVVMAKVHGVLEELVAETASQPGLFWSAGTLERAREATDYLQEAITALDADLHSRRARPATIPFACIPCCEQRQRRNPPHGFRSAEPGLAQRLVSGGLSA